MTARPPFEQVVRRHGGDVWRFCAAQVGAGRADDLFQDTMLAALDTYPSLRNPDAVKTWLLRIAARKAVDTFRAAARAPAAVPDPEPGAVPGPQPPEERLWDQVRALPTKQRHAVALRFVLDLEHAQIAEVMHTSTDAARRNVFEGVRSLRAHLDPPTRSEP